MNQVMEAVNMKRDYVARREWILAVVLSCGMSGLLQIPYLLGYLTARVGTAYSGLLVHISDATYLVAIQLGMQGEWLYRIRFTSEPHAGAFLYTFYLALGHLARLLNLDAVTMWHLSLGVTSFILFLIVFGFIAYFIPHPNWRLVAFLIALFGAGYDVFPIPFETVAPTSGVPLDLRMPEAHLFYSALTYPHYSAAIALILVSFWCALRGMLENISSTRWIGLLCVGALASVGVAMVYPFLVLLTASVLSAFYLFLAWRKRKILWRAGIFLVLMFVPVAPLLLYYLNVLATNPVIRAWNEQVQTLSPNPLHYLLTYGIYLALALWNLWRVGFGNENAERLAFLWIWLGIVALLLYAPLNAQRRFVEGVHVPLAILATIGLYETALPRLARAHWFQNLARRPHYSVAGLKNFFAAIFFGAVAFSSVFLYLSALLMLTVQQPDQLFRPQGEIAAMAWLKKNADREALVLSSYASGAWLPYRAETRAYIGQYYETNHFADKFKQVEKFFDARTADSARVDFLRAQKIEYVFYGNAERALGTFDPARVPYLMRLFENADAQVYAVQVP